MRARPRGTWGSRGRGQWRTRGPVSHRQRHRVGSGAPTTQGQAGFSGRGSSPDPPLPGSPAGVDVAPSVKSSSECPAPQPQPSGLSSKCRLAQPLPGARPVSPGCWGRAGWGAGSASGNPRAACLSRLTAPHPSIHDAAAACAPDGRGSSRPLKEVGGRHNHPRPESPQCPRPTDKLGCVHSVDGHTTQAQHPAHAVPRHWPGPRP